MPKSKIIKDLANGTVDTLTALKRTKVLLAEFENEDLNTWISNEITGYLISRKYRIIEWFVEILWGLISKARWLHI